MEILFVLVPISLVIVSMIFLAFIWAVRSGQFDDLDKEAQRILFDPDLQQPQKKKGDTQ